MKITKNLLTQDHSYLKYTLSQQVYNHGYIILPVQQSRQVTRALLDGDRTCHKKIPQNSGKQIQIPEGMQFNSPVSKKSKKAGHWRKITKPLFSRRIYFRYPNLLSAILGDFFCDMSYPHQVVLRQFSSIRIILSILDIKSTFHRISKQLVLTMQFVNLDSKSVKKARSHKQQHFERISLKIAIFQCESSI